MSPYAPYIDWIDSRRDFMVQRVLAWSAINSGSYHLAGLERMLTALQTDFAELGGRITVHDAAPMVQISAAGEKIKRQLGRALQITKHPDAALRIFLGGHMDTVYSEDHPFQNTHQPDERHLVGPGVADLKGGLAVMLTALAALERSPFAGRVGWEVVINADEEIGSHGSAALLTACAARNHLGLLYEPALPDGAMAEARKGSGNFTVVARGRSAHAGRAFEHGRNAIVALADYTRALFDLNGRRTGVTVNPGRVEGGGPLNVVPDLAILRFNARMRTEEDKQWLEKALIGLDASFRRQDGIVIERHGLFSRPPKPVGPAQEALMAVVTDCGRALGLTLSWQPTGGCCDGNNLAAAGLPNVDTMGVRGGDIHSDQEFVVIDSLIERARLSALLLMRLADGTVEVPG